MVDKTQVMVKGFGGGADFVMLGGMFQCHGKGKLVKSNGSKYIEP